MTRHNSGAASQSGEVVSSRDAAEHYVALVCFKIGPPRLVGIELEWLVHDERDPALAIPASRLASALGPWAPGSLNGSQASQHHPYLPRGSAVTVEPGGQIELSSLPAAGIAACIEDMSADSAALREVLAAGGLTLGGSGIDPVRPPSRVLHTPRYDAMESYFDRTGPDGRTMMCSTAAVQVSLDAGTAVGAAGTADPLPLASRWSALHTLGPVLVATFANSPVRAGSATGWRSSRQAAWLGTDPARTAPAAPGGDPREEYARFAVDAPVLCVRRGDGSWLVPSGVTFGEWVEGALGDPPTYADLDYHLTTLFPPVRPQGHLEVRYIDTQRGDGWIVPAAVLWALTSDARALDSAVRAAEPFAGRWRHAARYGLADPGLALAAAEVLAAAQDALAADPAIAAAVGEFGDRYTFRGRSPADDWLPGELAPAGAPYCSMRGAVSGEAL